MRKTIVIAVGGTGGHVLPAQKIGKELSCRFDVIYIGVGLSENRFFEKTSATYYDVDGSGASLSLIKAVYKNLRGIKKATKLLKELKPEFILGFGSFHSFPVLSSGAYLGIPYYLFEFNVVPGRVNRLFSKGAKKVFIHFEPRKKKIRGRIEKIDITFDQEDKLICQKKARAHFGLKEDKKTILVFGGSIGASAINEVMIKTAPLLQEEFQILHFCGKEGDVESSYQKNQIDAKVMSFCDRMDLAWNASDFAICRSGAGAMREILMYKKPAILVPYPTAKDDHQKQNAKFMQEDVKGAVYIDQKELTPSKLAKKIKEVSNNLDELTLNIEEYKNNENNPFFAEVL